LRQASRKGFAQSETGAATEGRPYEVFTITVIPLRFVGVALRGHPRVDFLCKALPGIEAPELLPVLKRRNYLWGRNYFSGKAGIKSS